MKSIDVLNLFSANDGSLSSLLQARVAKNPKAECLVFEKERTWTWKEFQTWVAGLSSWLETKKLAKGDKVAILSRNNDLFVALIFAIADRGLVLVPINPDLTENECQYILKHSEAKFILAEKEFSALAKKAAPSGTVCIPLDASFLEKRSTVLKTTAKADDLFLILYTSGTTGFPKGVMHTQKTAVMAGEAFVERMLLEPTDRLFCILPFFHINALFYSLMGSFAAGATLLVTKKFSASKFWSMATDLKATQVNIIAAVGNILCQRDRSEFKKNHTIKKVYGAPVSTQTESIFKNEFNIPITLEGYGMTEIPGAINNQIEGKWKVGTMGVAAKHPDYSLTFTELKIVDEVEKEVEPGAVGELVVRTPLLMQGYFKDEKQTAESFTADKYFKSGDLVKQDSEGFYHFVSRKKDIIRRRGENISGAEIDRIVGNHPKVAEVATIGVPSSLGEEEIFIAVVAREEMKLSEKEIFSWCSEHLSKIKTPKFIKLFKSLPHTPTARVAKFKLKQDSELMSGAKEFP
jgi:crotonobetaine/carnitine-CoA ligase